MRLRKSARLTATYTDQLVPERLIYIVKWNNFDVNLNDIHPTTRGEGCYTDGKQTTLNKYFGGCVCGPLSWVHLKNRSDLFMSIRKSQTTWSVISDTLLIAIPDSDLIYNSLNLNYVTFRPALYTFFR